MATSKLTAIRNFPPSLITPWLQLAVCIPFQLHMCYTISLKPGYSTILSLAFILFSQSFCFLPLPLGRIFCVLFVRHH